MLLLYSLNTAICLCYFKPLHLLTLIKFFASFISYNEMKYELSHCINLKTLALMFFSHFCLINLYFRKMKFTKFCIFLYILMFNKNAFTLIFRKEVILSYFKFEINTRYQITGKYGFRCPIDVLIKIIRNRILFTFQLNLMINFIYDNWAIKSWE